MHTLLQIIWIIHHFPNIGKIEFLQKNVLYIKKVLISLNHG